MQKKKCVCICIFFCNFLTHCVRVIMERLLVHELLSEQVRSHKGKVASQV